MGKQKKQAKTPTNSSPLNTPFGIKSYSHVTPKEVPPKEFYANYTGTDNHILDLLKYLYDPTQWSLNFHNHFLHKPQRRRVMRMMVQAGTIDAFLRGSYTLTDGTIVRMSKKIVDRASLKTIMYGNDFDYSTPAPKTSEEKANKNKSDKKQHEDKKVAAEDTAVGEVEEGNIDTKITTNNATKSQKENNTNKINPKGDSEEETEDEFEEIDEGEQEGEQDEENEDEREGEEIGKEEENQVEHEDEDEVETEAEDGEEEEGEEAQLSSKLTDMKIDELVKSKVIIVEGDSIEVGLWVKNYLKVNPVILNMASMTNPGGGYRSGSGAQEESLHRRTNLFQCLEDPFRTSKNRTWSYPIPEFGGVYSPNVTVIRSSEEQGYAFKAAPESISFVSVAAYSNPPTETLPSEEVVLSKKIAQLTRRKIDTIFKIAIHNGHDALILGAFGCGAYCNPAQHIAKLFNEALAVYKSYFKIVVFAILDAKTGMNPEGNLVAFCVGLKCDVVKFRDLPVQKPT